MTEVPIAIVHEEPRVLDTYALVYAFILLFLVPGSILIGRLPFRTYTFSYVSLVTMPFVLALLLTFLTDSRDRARTVATRVAVLVPIVLLTGVSVLFTSSLLLLPINRFLGPEYRAETTPLAALLLVGLASPLALAMVKRVRGRMSARSVFQGLILLLAMVLVGAVVYVSVWRVGLLGDIARKDIVIYIIGGLVWYGPAFGIAAGVWRRIGLV
ncbi:MAG: hypothetical protein CVT67_03830 [Actinobacteria bacterium HGW-Actinobacteria-7]|jgi:hypothetical protein|nr:MAG: hypothetical protein CVT67_03830 [Actinobacteria bacterium HGW-Actinobacteria-7]